MYLSTSVIFPSIYIYNGPDLNKYSDLFRLCTPPPPPQLSGCSLFATPDTGAIFLHNDLPCNGACSVTGEGGGGGGRTYWGAQAEKKSKNSAILNVH